MATITPTFTGYNNEVSLPHPHGQEIHPFHVDDPSVDYVGKWVYMGANKRLLLASAAAAGTAKCLGLVTQQTGRVASVLKRGWVGSQFDVTSKTPGAQAFLSDTAGVAADTAGTVSTILGRFLPATDGAGGGTPGDDTLLLYVDILWA